MNDRLLPVVLLFVLAFVMSVPLVNATTLTIANTLPTNAIVDQGQWQSITVSVSGGTAAATNTFSVNVVNSISPGLIVNTIVSSALSTNTFTATWFVGANEPSNSPIDVNVLVTDSASDTPANTVYSTYKAYNALQTPTLATPSNTMLDAGQYVLITPTISGGAPNYVQNIIISNSITKVPINSISAIVSSGTAELFYLPSWVVGNSLQVNVVITDSATTNSIANSIYVPLGFNSVLNSAPTFSISNTLVDSGQYSTFTVNTVSPGGTSPYNALFTISNSVTGAVVNSILVTGATPTATFYFPSWYAGNTLRANVLIRDSATTNGIANSIYVPLGFNSVLNSAPTFSISNTLVDSGQYSTFTVNTVSPGGTSPYNALFTISNSVTGAVVNSILVTGATPTATFYFPSWYAGNTLRANVLIRDSATTNGIANSIYSPLGFNSVLTGTPSLLISNTLAIDSGQWETLTASGWSAGTTPYTINFLVYNSVTNVIVFNDLLTGDIATSNTFTFQVTGNSGNTLNANVFVKDSASTAVTVNSVLSQTITVNTALSTPTISPSSAQSYTTGQTVTFAAYETGGSLPYTYNFLVYNSDTNIIVANMLTTSNSFAYVLPSGEAGNTLNANVFVTDNAVSGTVNSILSGLITVSSPPPCSNCVQGSGGSGVFLTTTIVKTTTTVPQTTVPQTTAPSTTTIPFSITTNNTFSNSSATNINVTNVGLLLTIVAQGNGSKGKVTVTNVTNNVPNPPQGFATVVAVNISIAAPNVSTNVTFAYPCAISASKIAPYKLENGTWQPIPKFTVNAARCLVAFSITNDPIIGLFQNTVQQPTSASANSTTVPPPLTAQTTVPAYSSATPTGSYVLWIIVAIVVIIFVVWYLNKGQRRRLK